ncbi:NACHT domain-containing NTPase [Microcoleus sp. FACHB-1515]|uniref:NACHT domain-containing protein n=1 Tax=Microcoleus sp. FACHB-1515 TaxID=2692821 RepID=UPI001A7E9BB6|nr:NACHT domain-containing NTPase [Microcoleus sp. FACHB-1515]
MQICQALNLDWQAIADLSTASQPAEPEPIDPPNIDRLVEEVRDRIQPLIEQACGTMRVLDMSYPIGLDDIYTDVNILERITSRRGLEWAEMMREAGREQFDRFCLGDVREQRVPGLVAVERFDKLMILGKPGAGKTTFLKRLAMQCIGGKFKPDRVPVFVTLKDFAEAESQPNLLEYLDRWSGLSFEAIVQAGRAIILLDGLDEVREVDSDRVLRQIKAFSQQYAQNCFVITCRIAAKEYTYEQFTEVEVADFDDRQIAEFSNNWFRSRNDAVKAKRFLEKLKEDKPIRELAASPLLLTLLCLVFEDSGDFPSNRAELYQNGVDVLLKKWDVKRNIERDRVYKGLSLKRKEALLGQIARKTFEAGNYFFKQREAERYISEYIQNLPDASTDPEALEVDSAAVLKSIESHHGLFVERARGIYSFSHLTFHEFFTAQEFTNNSDPQKLEQSLQTLVNHITERRYREVFLLTISILNNATILMQLMKAKIDNILEKNKKLQQFLEWTSQKAISSKAPYRLTAIRAFYFFYGAEELGWRHVTNPQRSIEVLPGPPDLAILLDSTFQATDDNEDLLTCGLALDTVCTFANSFPDSKNISGIVKVIKNSLTASRDAETLKELSTLGQELPDPEFVEEKALLKWYNTKGKSWVKQLRILMIKYRDVGHNWQFSEEQEELLHQYYDANLLLVNCLNSDCYVSREVRQEIEETLLLPIAEIEAWKQNKGKS